MVGTTASVVAILLMASDPQPPAWPTVREERPRIFVRENAWNGPSVAKIKGWMETPEYRQRARKLPRSMMGNAVLYLVNKDEAAGRRAVAQFKGFRIGGGSPTNWGDSAQYYAALYDWLHDHPDFDEASRKAAVAHMEQWGDKMVAYLEGGGATPFYCRTSGVLAGLTCLGLSLHGDSPKAEGYARYAQRFLCERFGTIREMEDGATGGASYGLHWEFTHLAHLAAAWRSATDWDAAQWIKRRQGNWLERQLLWQIWTTYANGWFVKDGDVWGGSHTDRTQYRMHIDAITGMYRHGIGRAWADRMARRWPHDEYYSRDYHSNYIWEFFIFNDPDVPPKPLETLGRAEVFSPKLHGWAVWRTGWGPDATVVHFKCGETVDHHGTYDQGKFLIFKRTPLAIKSGGYVGYKTPHHMYFKSPWSANCVVFTGPEFNGEQPHIDFDGTPSWKEWKAERDRRFRRPPTGVLVATEANDGFARALGDLTGSAPKGSSWTRELVFLGYQYLLVLDRVKAGPGLEHRWTLHTVNEPQVEGGLALADNAPGRLFCRTLLPEKAKLTKVGGPGHEFDYNGRNRPPKGWGTKTFPPERRMGAWRLDVTPADGRAECVYLHVLFPTDTKTDRLPPCSLERDGADLIVTVGKLTYTFRRAP